MNQGPEILLAINHRVTLYAKQKLTDTKDIIPENSSWPGAEKTNYISGKALHFIKRRFCSLTSTSKYTGEKNCFTTKTVKAFTKKPDTS